MDDSLDYSTESEDTLDVPLEGSLPDELGETPFIYDEDSLNLVDAFKAHEEGEEALKKIANEVFDNFTSDWESSEQYRKRVEGDWRIWAGELPEKALLFKDAANAHLPILLENMSRLLLRAFGELFGDWSNVFGVLPLGSEDRQTAELLSLHGNWQLRNQIPDFKRQMHRALLAFLGPGDVTIHSFYDESRKENRHEVLTCDEFVIPYVFTTTMPDYSDVPRRTKVLMRYRHDLEAMRGIWSDVDKVLKDKNGPSLDSEPEQSFAETVAKVQGVEPDDAGIAPYKVLWYEGWMELPNQDKQRFVQVIMDYSTKTIFRLTIHEEPSWQDKSAYEAKLKELAAFRDLQNQYQAQLQQHQEMQGQLGQQLGGAQIGPEQALQGLQQLDAQEPQPPTPPGWMENPDDPNETPKQPDKKPIHLFVHGVCLENMRGALGLGYGRVMADFNRAGNVALSQFIDAATLANCKMIITTENVEFNGGLKLQPGGQLKVSGVSGSELKDNVMPFGFDGPRGELLQVVELMQQSGEGAMQAPAVLSGAEGKSGETYRGIAARIEQATKQLSVSTRKFSDEVLVNTLKNNAYLNSIFLPDYELIQLESNLVPAGQPSQIPISRKLYERNYQIEIRADLQFAARAQKIQEADDVLGLVEKIPQLQQNIPLVYEVVKRSLIARGFRDIAAYLGPQPPPPQTPLGIPPPPLPMPPGPPGSTGKPAMPMQGNPPGPGPQSPQMPPHPPMPPAPGGPPQGMVS
jgi:hypothetical protein